MHVIRRRVINPPVQLKLFWAPWREIVELLYIIDRHSYFKLMCTKVVAKLIPNWMLNLYSICGQLRKLFKFQLLLFQKSLVRRELRKTCQKYYVCFPSFYFLPPVTNATLLIYFNLTEFHLTKYENELDILKH